MGITPIRKGKHACQNEKAKQPYSNTRTQTTTPTLCPNGRAPRQNAPLRRLQPPSGAAAVQRGEQRIQGGSRGKSQSPWPSLAAGGCHAAAAAANSGARTRRETRKATAERKSTHKSLTNTAERCVRTQRSAASNPLAERRRYKGVSRESKEGVGGNRNPPIPPWPPEAATRLLPQPTAAQGRAAKPQGDGRTQSNIQTLRYCGRAPRKNAALRCCHPPNAPYCKTSP